MELVAWIQGDKLELFEFKETMFASWTKEETGMVCRCGSLLPVEFSKQKGEMKGRVRSWPHAMSIPVFLHSHLSQGTMLCHCPQITPITQAGLELPDPLSSPSLVLGLEVYSMCLLRLAFRVHTLGLILVIRAFTLLSLV